MLTWLSLLKMGGAEKEGNRYDVPDFCGCPRGPNGPHPTVIAAVLCCIAAML